MLIKPTEAQTIIEHLSARLAELVRLCDSTSKEQGSGVALAWREVVAALSQAAEDYDRGCAEWEAHKHDGRGNDDEQDLPF